MLETCETTADARHLIYKRCVPSVGLGSGKVDEAVYIALDLIEGQCVLDRLVLGRDGEALALHPERLTHDCSSLVQSIAGGTGTVDTSQIATETRTP